MNDSEGASARPSTLHRCTEIIKVARPGFWPTHLWFYVLPLMQADLLDLPAFWVGCFYVCFPLGLLLYGWNDLGDAASDEINERKDSWLFGAKPDSELRQALPKWILLVQLPFVVAMVWLAGWKMLGWFFAVALVNFTYNNLRFKSIPVLDLLNQAGYLLTFVLASWLCQMPQINAPAFWFAFLFSMQSHLFGQLMDIDADRTAGRHSTAVTIGAQPAKFLLVAIMLSEVAVSAIYFRSPLVAWFMSAGAVFFFCDALLGPKRYPVWFTKLFFVLWNIIVIVTMHWVWRYGLFLLAE